MTNYPLQLNLRIDWSEMDLYGHVNNVTYFKYIQAGRVNYWEALGLNKLFETDKSGLILASTSCNFRKPLHYPGQINVRTGIDSIGQTSFVLLHQIVNEAGIICAEAKDVVVFYDFSKNEKMQVPAEIRTMIDKVERAINLQ